MAIYSSFRLLLKHPFECHHIAYGFIAAVFIFFSPLYGQELEINLNAYRTALAVYETGDWDDPLTWEVWDGLFWNSASAPPNRNNDVYIEKDMEVRLTQNQEVANLYLYGRDSTNSPPGKKLNLQEFDLDVHGTLICFKGVGGNYSLQNLTSGITDWIYPETGNIIFKGLTRTIVDRASWSANNGRSSYGVIFNPDPDDTLWVNAAFKANRFVVRSGTVVQKVNYAGTPATSTFSFNTMNEYGDGAYGEFIIESGATLISEGTKDFNQIVRRSDGKPASRFELMEGGNLILLGEEPVIDAENILLEGDVYYSGNSGTQRFISGTMVGVVQPSSYNNLFFEGNAIKSLPELLELKGNFTHLEGGTINGTNTALHFIGDGDQEVIQTSLHLKEAHLNKSTGVLSFDDNLTVDSNFEMISGEIDFQTNHLFIHGNYTYLSGNWQNLSQLSYQNIPIVLTPSNSTFPFVDGYLGGERKILLSGSLSSSNTDLTLSYTQLPGVNWDADFNDYDNTPILYKLNSYFTFTLEDFVETENLEIQISADNLIVVNDAHLRIVGDKEAAPGDHHTGFENKARRTVDLGDLNSQILTIGSTGIASILPVAWLSHKATQLSTGNLISWTTAQERSNKKFFILKSINAIDFNEVGRLLGKGYSNQIQHYDFLDKSINASNRIYYQIKQVDFEGSYDFSPVFHLILTGSDDRISVFPNPYYNQRSPMTIRVPEKLVGIPAQISVKHVSGIAVAQEAGILEEVARKVAEHLEELSAGIYLIIIESNLKQQVIKWLKEN